MTISCPRIFINIHQEYMAKIDIREWTLKDKEALTTLCNAVDRRFLSDRMPFPYTEDDAVQWLTMVQEKEGKDGVFRAIVEDGEIIGSVSVERDSSLKSDGEIGYMLSKNYWNQGIATQVVALICNTVFKELSLQRIIGKVYEPNVASARVLEKNGFTRKSTHPDAIFKNGMTYNVLVYELATN